MHSMREVYCIKTKHQTYRGSHYRAARRLAARPLRPSIYPRLLLRLAGYRTTPLALRSRRYLES